MTWFWRSLSSSLILFLCFFRDGGHLWGDGGGELLHASGTSFTQEETQEQRQRGELGQTQEAQVDLHWETCSSLVVSCTNGPSAVTGRRICCITLMCIRASSRSIRTCRNLRSTNASATAGRGWTWRIEVITWRERAWRKMASTR